MKRFSVILTLAGIAAFGSEYAYAQSDQLIVMECAFPNQENRMTLTLDLAGKKVSMDLFTPNPGGTPDPIRSSDPAGTVTQISDDKINFVTGRDTNNQWLHTLNRYNGRDTVQASNWTADWVCHKQQKQF